MKRLLFVAVVCAVIDACAVELVVAKEVRTREGIGNVLAKLESHESVTVA